MTIGYNVPWQQVDAMVLMTSDGTQGVLKEPEPFILHQFLEDFYITYELNACTNF